jgi:hypothetical protein
MVVLLRFPCMGIQDVTISLTVAMVCNFNTIEALSTQYYTVRKKSKYTHKHQIISQIY